MRVIEQKIDGIIQTIPDQPLNLIVSDRFIVLSLLSHTLHNTHPEKPDFQIIGFNNDLRTPMQTLTLTLKKAYPLNDFLLHFLEVIVAMGITNPTLCRNVADIHDSVTQYERAMFGDIYEEGSREYQEREKKENRKYLIQHSTSIVEYIDPEEAHDRVVYAGYNPKHFIETERDRRKIILEPGKDKIGFLPPTLILEAYLLYLLQTGNILV